MMCSFDENLMALNLDAQLSWGAQITKSLVFGVDVVY